MTQINPIECISGNNRGKLSISEKSVFKVDLKGKRICFVFNTGIGDIFFVTPLVKYLKSKDKTLKIELCVPRQYIELFKRIPGITDIFPLQELQVRQYYMDYLFNFGMAITKFEQAQQLSAAKTYFRYIDKEFDFTRMDDEYFRPEIIMNPYSIVDAQNYFKKHLLFKHPVVALQLRSSSPIRCWLPEYNREVAFTLASHGYKVLLFDSNSLWEVKRDNILLVKEELSTVFAMISLCDLVVAPDSSFIQMGMALNKPTIGIYGAFPAKYRMMDLGNTYPFECDKKQFKCSPCFQHRSYCPKGEIPSPCMMSIKPQGIIDLVDSLLIETEKEFCIPSKIKSIKSCTFCGASDFNILAEWGEQYIDNGRLCSSCGSIYNPDIKTDSIISIYNNEMYFAQRYMNPGYKKDCQFIFESLKELLPKNQSACKTDFKIADIGCGIGTLASMMKTLPGAKVFGIDVSTHAYFLGKKINQFEITVKNFLKDKIFENEYLDLIVMSHYIEHSGGADIIANLEKAHSCLKKNGMLYIYSPSSDAFQRRAMYSKNKWIHLSGGDHIDIPSKKGLEILLNKVGFKNVTIRDRGGDDLDCITTKD